MSTQIYKHNQKFLIDNRCEQINWWIESFSKWEEETFIIFEKLLSKDKMFIDLGAWGGTTSLYACLLSKHVYAFEPDPNSLNDFYKNITINGFENITVIPKPIYHEITNICFGPYQDKGWNTSSSSIKIQPNNKLDTTMETITFNQFLDTYKVDNISLIKIDIEGGEEYIIPDIFNYVSTLGEKPPIYLSFHLDWWNDKNINRFSKYWELYKFTYYELKLIDCDRISETIRFSPFGSILFTDHELSFVDK